MFTEVWKSNECAILLSISIELNMTHNLYYKFFQNFTGHLHLKTHAISHFMRSYSVLGT